MKRLATALMTLAILLTMTAGSVAAPRKATAETPLPRVAISTTGMSINGVKFVPRGANYLRMSGSRITTFEEGEYDGVRADAMFTSLQSDGDRSVRVFVPPGDWGAKGIGGPLARTTPFNPAVVANVADFVKRGARHGVYTSLVLDDLPTNCYFYSFIHADGHCGTEYTTSNVFGTNAFYMDPGYVAAKAEYMRLFAAEMVTRLGTDITAILTYSANNEANFDAAQAPFTNWDTSTVTVVGTTYVMNVAAQRQEAADRAFVDWTLRVKAGLKAGDPNAKFTVGVYTNYAVNKVGFDGMVYCGSCTSTPNYRDTRYPARISKVLTIVDVAGIHFYPRPLTQTMVPGTGLYTVAKDLATVELTGTNLAARPLVVEEMGAFRSMYSTVTQAASAMKASRIAACKLGVDGYQFWTFDTAEQVRADGQQELYTLTQNNEAINQGQATSLNPDPCK